MKTKALSLTLAGLMSIQSVGFAQQDRTAGIGDQAIAAAQTNLQTLNQQMLLLDKSLAQAADSITKRDNKGGTTNGLAIAGAGLGLGLSAMSYLSFHKGTEGSGIGGMILATVSIAASLTSIVNGGTSQILKSTAKADTTELEKQLIEAQKGVETQLAQTSDKATAVALTQMGLAIKNTQTSLADYKDQESEVTLNRLASQAGQFVGTAILVYGITQKDSRAPMIGLMIMNAGNLGAILAGFQGSQAEEVLKEINQTRDSLKVASAALQ